MTVALRVALLVFVAAVIQVSVVVGIRVLGAEPDVLLVTLVAIGLLRGSVVGASAGFIGGLLVDIMTLGTLGLSSLLLTIAGYWAGRYGETTGHGRTYAPSVAAFVAAIAVSVGGSALHYLLGESVAAGEVGRALLPSAVLAAILVVPVSGVCRAVLGSAFQAPRAREVELV